MTEDRNDLPESTAVAKQDIAATRERMSQTIAQLEQRVSGTIDGVKQKVDVAAFARQHPWPALAAAFVAGVALSASGTDRKAARATTRAAKAAPGAAKRGAGSAVRATAAGVSQLASAAVQRVRGTPEERAGEGSGGLKAKATGAIQAQVRELREEVDRGASELGNSAPPRRSAGI